MATVSLRPPSSAEYGQRLQPHSPVSILVPKSKFAHIIPSWHQDVAQHRAEEKHTLAVAHGPAPPALGTSPAPVSPSSPPPVCSGRGSVLSLPAKSFHLQGLSPWCSLSLKCLLTILALLIPTQPSERAFQAPARLRRVHILHTSGATEQVSQVTARIQF